MKIGVRQEARFPYGQPFCYRDCFDIVGRKLVSPDTPVPALDLFHYARESLGGIPLFLEDVFRFQKYGV